MRDSKNKTSSRCEEVFTGYFGTVSIPQSYISSCPLARLAKDKAKTKAKSPRAKGGRIKLVVILYGWNL